MAAAISGALSGSNLRANSLPDREYAFLISSAVKASFPKRARSGSRLTYIELPTKAFPIAFTASNRFPIGAVKEMLVWNPKELKISGIDFAVHIIRNKADCIARQCPPGSAIKQPRKRDLPWTQMAKYFCYDPFRGSAQ